MLLEPCNFDCSHCLRSEEPMVPGYRLSFRQLQQCLADCCALKTITWVHFSGGEPTLWTEGELDLVDLLLEIAQAGYTPAFTTNGSLFVEPSRCQDFFERYVNSSAARLMVFLSIDTFHRNFNARGGRAQSLDNVVKCKQRLPPEKAESLDIRVAACVSKDTKSLLPDGMVRYYESLGISFAFGPLRPLGKARDLRHLCPDVDSEEPEDLGAFQCFHEPELRGSTPKQRRGREAGEALCLIGSDYFLPYQDPERGYRWPKVAHLGSMPQDIVQAYSRGNVG